MEISAADSARRSVLLSFGATPGIADELLTHPVSAGPPLPERALTRVLDDEPHVVAWQAYARDAEACGVFEALRRRFVQLRFPIRKGMSHEDAYRAATRRGEFDRAEPFAPGLVIEDPGGLSLALHATGAGRLPVLTSSSRPDFVALVQAFSERNEPAYIPRSVGACMVSGLNNWDRVAAHRVQWERNHQDDLFQSGWAEEFQRLARSKELYQDRFIILSRGAYSGVSAAEAGLPPEDWLERSLVIRREHECTHYLVCRLSGAVPHRVLDELVADFAGLLRAFGAYPEPLALRFLGLERSPALRPGGRLEYYRGSPALSDEAFAVVTRITARAVATLASVANAAGTRLRTVEALAHLVVVLSRLSLEELAGPGGEARALDEFERVERRSPLAIGPSHPE